MEEKIYFNLQKTDGTTEKKELLGKFTDDVINKKYIFYKNCDASNTHYYAASYDEKDENDYTNLDTNLSDKEKAKLNEIFDSLVSGGVENVWI